MKLLIDLVLASRSPRRRDLLQRLGVPFRIVPSSLEEAFSQGDAPEEVARSLALQKATDVGSHHPDALTLGADTIVVVDDRILGQPKDAEEAKMMLHRLAGRTHTVCSGLALVHPGSDRRVTAHETTEVTLSPIDATEIEAYVASGLPLDKAGAYGIQDRYGALFVEGIRGDYYSVMGLPLHRFYRMLQCNFADLFTLAHANEERR